MIPGSWYKLQSFSLSYFILESKVDTKRMHVTLQPKDVNASYSHLVSVGDSCPLPSEELSACWLSYDIIYKTDQVRVGLAYS